MADVPPNQTIYVNNLPDKIKKEGAAARRAWALLLRMHSKGLTEACGAAQS